MKRFLFTFTVGCTVWLVSGLLGGGLVLSQQQSPQSSSLSLSIEQAVGLALRRNPTVLAARQRIFGAQGRFTRSKAFSNPELAMVPAGLVDDAQLVAFQRIELFGKRHFRTKAAEWNLRAAQAYYRAVELRVSYEVTEAYLSLLQAQRLAQLTEEAVDLARQFHETAQRQYDAGDVPRAHVVRTGIEVSRLEQDATQADSEVQVRRAALNTVLAQDPATPIEAADELWYEPLTLDLETLKRLAFERRPEVQAAESEVRSAQYSVSEARAQRLPDVIVEGRLVKLTRNEGRALGIGLTLPLFDFGSIRGQVKEAEATARQQQALLQSIKNAVALEVEAAYRRMQAARQRVENYQRQIVPEAEGHMKMVQMSYLEGGSTLLEVIDGQRTMTAVRTEFVKALAEHALALADLRRAVGGNLPSAITNHKSPIANHQLPITNHQQKPREVTNGQ